MVISHIQGKERQLLKSEVNFRRGVRKKQSNEAEQPSTKKFLAQGLLRCDRSFKNIDSLCFE
jgi:hypothetical protein